MLNMVKFSFERFAGTFRCVRRVWQTVRVAPGRAWRSWRALREGIARFRDLGGKRAVVTNVRVALDSPTPSPEGPEDPCDLKCPRDVARERLHRLREWGFDDIVLAPGRHEAEHFHELRELTQSSR